jgi:hypothetical protein
MKVSTDAAGRGRVPPLNGTGIGRVGIDVAAKFASQVGHGSENAAGDDLAFNFGEPDFDLVEPTGIREGEMKLHARMLLEEISNRRRFMSGEVVEDDMNLLPGRAPGHDFFQEGEASLAFLLKT